MPPEGPHRRLCTYVSLPEGKELSWERALICHPPQQILSRDVDTLGLGVPYAGSTAVDSDCSTDPKECTPPRGSVSILPRVCEHGFHLFPDLGRLASLDAPRAGSGGFPIYTTTPLELYCHRLRAEV